MSEERIMILTMLQEGKISSEDAAKLLDALDELELKESEKNNLDNYHSTDSTPFEKIDTTKKDISSDKFKKYESKLENLGDKIDKKIEKHSQDFEDWGNSFGEKLSNKFVKIGDEITEGATSFTDKVLSFVDDLIDKGTFTNVFGGYDTVIDTIEKDISSIDNPSLEIQGINGKISVKPWSEEIISIKAVCQLKKGTYDKDTSVYDVVEDGKRIVFKPKYSGNIGTKLDVYIPEKHYERIFLFTSNGKIEAQDIHSNELLFDTTNASIRLNDLHSNRIKACTKNGKIVSTDVSGELFNVETTNSSIELSDINCSNIEASTKNGKILSSDTVSDELCLVTSNGQIMAEDCKSKYIKCKTHNANIKVEDIDTSCLDKVELITSNGQAELHFDDNTKAFKIDATTSMGYINIDIPNLIYTLNNQQQLGSKKVLAHSSNYIEGNSSIDVVASTSNGSIKID